MRKVTFEHYQKLHELLLETFGKLNFNMIELPFVSIEERANFVIEKVIDKFKSPAK